MHCGGVVPISWGVLGGQDALWGYMCSQDGTAPPAVGLVCTAVAVNIHWKITSFRN